MTKREMRYFNVAKSVALCSPHPRFYIGTCIVSKHQIISVSSNQIKSHPAQKKLNMFRFSPCDSSKDRIHAELSAILKVRNKEDLQNACIYVYRINRQNKLGMARPCPACLAKIKEVGIKTIYYTTPDGFCKEDLR